jgi:putative transposase
MDVTHVCCGRDGWGHLAAIIDCHDREIVGWEFALRGQRMWDERMEWWATLSPPDRQAI